MAKLLGQFSWHDGSSCEVLTVVRSVLGGSIPKWLAAPSRSAEVEDLIRVWVEEERNQLAAAQQEMQTICQALPTPMKKSNAKVAQGHAATEIIDAAQNLKADLIVIGSKASTPLGLVCRQHVRDGAKSRTVLSTRGSSWLNWGRHGRMQPLFAFRIAVERLAATISQAAYTPLRQLPAQAIAPESAATGSYVSRGFKQRLSKG